MYKLCFYVPESHLETVKDAVFRSGAGRIGDYDQCCWQCPGQGQFRPRAGSQPFLGTQDQLEQVLEYKVELVVADALVAEAVRALNAAHPYEEPPYQVWKLEDIAG